MSLSIRDGPHKPLFASHSVISSQIYTERERDLGSDLTGEAMCWYTPKHFNMKGWLKQASHTCDDSQSQSGNGVYTDRVVSVCSGQMVINKEKETQEKGGIHMFNSCYKLI